MLQADNAPVIDSTSISVSKREVTEGETIRFSVKIITDNAGVASASIAYLTPITAQTETISLYKNEVSGLCEGTLSVTDTTELGAWKASNIEALDIYGNSASLSNINLSGATFTINETTAMEVSKSVVEASSFEVLQASATLSEPATTSEKETGELATFSATEIVPAEMQETPDVSLAAEGTVSTSVHFDKIAAVTDILSDNTANYANGAPDLQWVQVDLVLPTTSTKSNYGIILVMAEPTKML